MEHLTKQQTILMAILVSIVTSITTGIVTVSLSDQSSDGVSNTIYQVIERTVEKVTPDDSPVRKIVEKEKPKEPVTLSVSDIAEKASAFIIRLYAKNSEGKRQMVSVGVATDNSGNILASNFIIPEGSLQEYIAINAKGEEIAVKIKKQNSVEGFDWFELVDQKNISKLVKVSLKDFSSLKLGSNVISFGSKDNNNVVSTGIVTEFSSRDPNATATSSKRELITTDMKLSSSISGWILLNTNAEIVGFFYPEIPVEGREKTAKFLSSALAASIPKQ